MKVIRIAQILLLSTAMVGNLAVANKGPADIDTLMNQSGMVAVLEALPEQIISGFEQAAPADDPGMAEFARLVERTVSGAALVEQVSAALQENLTRGDLKALNKWYATPMAQRITALENQAMDPEMMERTSAMLDSLMADEERVVMARELNDLVQASERAIQMAQMMQRALLAPMMVDMDTLDQELLLQQVDAELEKNRAEIDKYMAASSVATYASLDKTALQTYIDFLAQPAAQKFYSVSMDAMAAAFADMFGELGSAMMAVAEAAVTEGAD
ncbi:MAG: DUF2059 domain-containing protein [Pseudomonadota bacterium]